MFRNRRYIFFSYFSLLSFAVTSFLYCTLPLPRTLYSRACSVIFQPTVKAFLELDVILPPFPLRNYFCNTFFWMDGSLCWHNIRYTAMMSTNISTQIIDTLYIFEAVVDYDA